MNTLLKVRNLMVALVVATVVLAVPMAAWAKTQVKICLIQDNVEICYTQTLVETS